MSPARTTLTPSPIAAEAFTDAGAAVARLEEIYERNTKFLRDHFEAYVNGEPLSTRVLANYPFVRLTTSTYVRLDSRLASAVVPPRGANDSPLPRRARRRASRTQPPRPRTANLRVP